VTLNTAVPTRPHQGSSGRAKLRFRGRRARQRWQRSLKAGSGNSPALPLVRPLVRSGGASTSVGETVGIDVSDGCDPLVPNEVRDQPLALLWQIFRGHGMLRPTYSVGMLRLGCANRKGVHSLSTLTRARVIRVKRNTPPNTSQALRCSQPRPNCKRPVS